MTTLTDVLHHVEPDELERTRELTMQRTYVGPPVHDPTWVGAAMGQMLRTYVGGGNSPAFNYTNDGHTTVDDEGQRTNSYAGHNINHRQPD